MKAEQPNWTRQEVRSVYNRAINARMWTIFRELHEVYTLDVCRLFAIDDIHKYFPALKGT